MAVGRPTKPLVLPCALAVVLALVVGQVEARAQAGPGAAPASEIDLGRIFERAPALIEQVLQKGHTELFHLLEDVELLHIESEIDRYVGDPRDLNDATAYKLRLLPFHIRYPIYRQLVDQMTRLDSERSRRIYTVTPDSVRLIDLRIQPVDTLDAFSGQGVSGEIQRSLLTHFSARETADLGVFLLAQQPFFPDSDEGWDRVKHRIARGAVPVLLGALATGAGFDAGAFSHSSTIAARGERLRLGWYGGIRTLGVHLRPHLRSGLWLAAGGLEAAAGLADQIRPSANQPDRAFELALREGWLDQLARPLGWDAFFEAALSRSIQDPAGFSGDRTTARGGFFFKRDELPALPDIILRGSAEAETNLEDRRHLTAALGLEHLPSGITTMVQASRAQVGDGSGGDDDRLTGFVAGTTDPIAVIFTDDMHRLARQVEVEWERLSAIAERQAEWEERLVAGAATRTPEEAQRELRAFAALVAERDELLGRLASTLGDYLESRRHAYAFLGWSPAPDQLHGPLAASVLTAIRERVLGRLTALSKDLDGAVARLDPLRARIARLEESIEGIEARDPHDPALGAMRPSLAALRQDWERQVESVRQWLEAYDHFRAEARRILAATGQDRKALRRWDALRPAARRRIAWLSFHVQP